MLSDEERKEYIEHEILDRLYCLEGNDFDKNKVDDGYIKAVLNACKEAKNLIEKQQTEIEELKKENLEIRDWKYVIDSPIDLDKLKELDLIKIKGKEYVSKDKIKAKIKELEKGNKNTFIRGEKILVLQSLLEKE